MRDRRAEIVVFVLPALPFGDVGFDAQKPPLGLAPRLVQRYANQIQRDHHVFVHVRELREQLIIDVLRITFDVQHAAVLVSELQIVILAHNAVRTDVILRIVSLPQGVLQFKGKLVLLPGAVEIMENPKPFHRVQGKAVRADGGEIRRECILHTHEKVSHILQTPRRARWQRDRDVLLLDDRVAVQRLFQNFFIVLGSVDVLRVTLQRHHQILLQRLPPQRAIVDRELGGDRVVKTVDERSKTVTHHLFVVLAGVLVIDVCKHVGHAVPGVREKQPVLIDPSNRDQILHTTGNAVADAVKSPEPPDGLHHADIPPSPIS